MTIPVVFSQLNGSCSDTVHVEKHITALGEEMLQENWRIMLPVCLIDERYVSLISMHL